MEFDVTTNIRYAVIPDNSSAADCGDSPGFGNMTSVVSHEVTEAVTDPEVKRAVGDVYRSLWRGVPAAQVENGDFFALVITGTQGRAVIREWLETSVDSAQRNLANHFRDLDIVWNAPPTKAGSLPKVAHG